MPRSSAKGTASPAAPSFGAFASRLLRAGSLSAFFTPFRGIANGRYLAYVAAGDVRHHIRNRRRLVFQDCSAPSVPGTRLSSCEPSTVLVARQPLDWILRRKQPEKSAGNHRCDTDHREQRRHDLRCHVGVRDDILFPGSLRGMDACIGRQRSGHPRNPGARKPFSPQFLSDGLHFIYSVPAGSAIGLARTDGGSPRTLMTLPVGTDRARLQPRARVLRAGRCAVQRVGLENDRTHR
jgi:hypothetical protein